MQASLTNFSSLGGNSFHGYSQGSRTIRSLCVESAAIKAGDQAFAFKGTVNLEPQVTKLISQPTLTLEETFDRLNLFSVVRISNASVRSSSIEEKRNAITKNAQGGITTQFVDTNIFIRHLTGDDPVKAQACFQLVQTSK